MTFLGEEGSDGGGLSREFFRLVAAHSSKYLEATGCFKHNSLALKVVVNYVVAEVATVRQENPANNVATIHNKNMIQHVIIHFISFFL